MKVDRVACPRLIQTFVAPQAEFIFAPTDQVASRAREPGATPFDIDGGEPGHHGEDVSFNSILKKFNLTDPAPELLGEIVRAADLHPANPHPARRAALGGVRFQRPRLERSRNSGARVHRL